MNENFVICQALLPFILILSIGVVFWLYYYYNAYEYCALCDRYRKRRNLKRLDVGDEIVLICKDSCKDRYRTRNT